MIDGTSITVHSRRRDFWQRYLVLALGLAAALAVWNPLWWRLNLLLFGGPVVVAVIWLRDTRVAAQWAAYAASFAIFVFLRPMVDDWGPGPFAEYVITLDRWLGLGTVPTVALQHAFYDSTAPAWWDWLGTIVYQSYYVCVPLVGLLVWRYRPAYLGPYLLGMSLAYLLGLFFHWLAPTVPPWMASMDGLLPPLHRPAWELIGGWDSRATDAYMEFARKVDGNAVAAMPSLHTAAAVLVARAAWMGPRWVRVLGITYAVFMLLVLVYFAEHYIVDGLAGAFLLLACWKMVPASKGRGAGIAL
ncbi:MAG TPA: phosphatase PAP2 family protein [Gemmatimonadales bacterium]